MDKDEKLADLVLLGMHTGARIEELCSLLCKDINLIEESIAIRNAKTEAGERVIPIHSAIKDRVTQMIEKSTDDYLFTKLNKNKYGDRSNSLGKRFGRMKVKVGFTTRQYSFHSIRKTFTTLLENAGVGENITADIIGHEKPRITYGLYSGGSTLETMRESIEKIRYKFT
jgi:integrase